MNIEPYTFVAQVKRKTFWSKRIIILKDNKLSYYKIEKEDDKKTFYLDSLKFSTKINHNNKEYTICFYRESNFRSK